MALDILISCEICKASHFSAFTISAAVLIEIPILYIHFLVKRTSGVEKKYGQQSFCNCKGFRKKSYMIHMVTLCFSNEKNFYTYVLRNNVILTLFYFFLAQLVVPFLMKYGSFSNDFVSFLWRIPERRIPHFPVRVPTFYYIFPSPATKTLCPVLWNA